MTASVRTTAFLACVLTLGSPAGPEFAEAVAGLKVAVEVLPADWRPNARVEFHCIVQNTTDRPVRTVAWGFDLTRVLEIRDATGKVIVPETERKEAARVPRGVIVTLEPGASQRFVLKGRITPEKALVVRELAGGTWTWSLREGSLSVSAAFERSAADALAPSLAKAGYWTGKAVSPAARVVMTGVALEPGGAVDGLRLKLAAENTDLRMTPAPDGGWAVEPAKLEISFVNEADDPLQVNVRDLLTGLARFEIEGPDDASVRVTRTDAPIVLGDKSDVAILDPNTGWSPQTPVTFPGKLGGFSYELLKPGPYRVTAVYASSVRGRWTGLVESNVVVFNVLGGPTPAGTPVKGLKLELSADPNEISLDPDSIGTKLTITFTNAGDAPLKLDAYDLVFRHMKLDVVGPDGKPLVPGRVMLKRAVIPPTEGDYPTLEPGQSWSDKFKPRFPGIFGQWSFRATLPGEYRLKVAYENKPLPEGGEYHPFAKGSWTGILTSNEVTINVIGALKPPR